MKSIQSVRENKHLMAYTAAAMYGGGVVVNGIEALIPAGRPSR